MASTAASARPLAETADGEVSVLRLYVLRATYLLLIVGLGITVVPQLFDHPASSRGVIAGVLSGMWVLAFLGLRYPLQMLPLLLFEMIWKWVWTLKYGLPQYFSGARAPTWSDDFPAIVAGVILIPLVIPWGYVWRRFAAGPADSVGDGATLVRLRVIRVAFALMFVAGVWFIGRIFLNPVPMERGVFASFLIALFVLNPLVIRHPLKMLPILLLECVWKAIWLVAFGLPQWLSGTGPASLSEDIIAVGLGPVFFALLIPWGYAWRHYATKPAERWR